MIDKEQLLKELNQSTNDLILELQQCEENHFNRRPAENWWSVAQIAEHILLLETQVNYALRKAETTQRQIDLKVMPMKLGMNNLERKYSAPDFILPSADHKEREQLIEGLKKQRDLLKQLIETTDLTETPVYKHPVIGDMTRLEWIHFVIYHSERHIKQMQRISRELNTVKEWMFNSQCSMINIQVGSKTPINT